MTAPQKSPDDSPGTDLVRQPHGGSLKRGNNHGNKGGRPPNRIKAQCRKDFDAVRPLLKELALTGRFSDKKKRAEGDTSPRFVSEPGSVADRLRAIDMLAKYGMDQNISIVDVRAALRATQEELRETLPEELFKMVWARILPHWLKL